MNRQLESYEEVARVFWLYLGKYKPPQDDKPYFDNLAELARCANRKIEDQDLKIAQLEDERDSLLQKIEDLESYVGRNPYF